MIDRRIVNLLIHVSVNWWFFPYLAQLHLGLWLTFVPYRFQKRGEGSDPYSRSDAHAHWVVEYIRQWGSERPVHRQPAITTCNHGPVTLRTLCSGKQSHPQPLPFIGCVRNGAQGVGSVLEGALFGEHGLSRGKWGPISMDRDGGWPHGTVQVPFTEGQSLLLWLGLMPLPRGKLSQFSDPCFGSKHHEAWWKRPWLWLFLFLFFFLFCSCYQRNKAEAESALKAYLSCCYCASPVFSHFHLLVYSYNFIFLFFFF